MVVCVSQWPQWSQGHRVVVPNSGSQRAGRLGEDHECAVLRRGAERVGIGAHMRPLFVASCLLLGLQFGMMGPISTQHGFARNVAFEVVDKEPWKVVMVGAGCRSATNLLLSHHVC
jgi:hypothetical protein